MESNRIFCGNGKLFGQYGGIKISICVDDIPAEWIKKSTKNGKRYVSLNINANKNGIDQYDNTHNVSVDTFIPDPNYRQGQQSQPPQQASPFSSSSQQPPQQAQQNSGFDNPSSEEIPF